MNQKKVKEDDRVALGCVFGRLTVIGEQFRVYKRSNVVGRKYTSYIKIKVLCSCGVAKDVYKNGLVAGRITSCGCWLSEFTHKTKFKHGLTGKRIHRIWTKMKARCSNPNEINYSRYGALGVKVCREWEESFDLFLSDMGYPPTDKHSIDRIDSNLGYFKDNCRWATISEQARNKKNNVFINFNGVLKTVGQWSGIYGVKQSTINYRIKNGWDIERAIKQKV